MPNLGLSPTQWGTLLEMIDRRLCTPFLGAGASFGPLPLAKDLALELLDEEERLTATPCPLRDREDLAAAAQYVGVNRESMLSPKLRIATKIQARQEATPDGYFDVEDEPHRVLADLRLPLYLTTNYDDFMVRALKRHRVPVLREFLRWNEDLARDEPMTCEIDPKEETPVVFHLHGHTETPASIVVSEDDYLDFLVSISREIAAASLSARSTSPLPPSIRKKIRTTTLLFIGYSLKDVNFRLVLRGLVRPMAPSQGKFHLAVQYEGNNGDELRNYLLRYFKSMFDLTVIFGTPRQFASELRRRRP